MKTGDNLSGRLNAPLLHRAATCCLLLAAVTALANLGGLVLVIARGVLPGWAVSAMLLVASLALLLISRRAAGGVSRTRRNALISLLHRLAVFGVGVSSLTGRWVT
ncbi:hypothetical protein G9E11_06095 [Arthrobacter sp. IA7]|uniref:hypothetical protein n=1 Tax=Arthrobacter ipis TaxID=2716202 RepID=UPI001682CF4D|nr:hypothetical protein [Arthrobacter ipis]MBD1541826.1 hypothetical protein [Arthrobacter ipis]